MTRPPRLSRHPGDDGHRVGGRRVARRPGASGRGPVVGVAVGVGVRYKRRRRGHALGLGRRGSLVGASVGAGRRPLGGGRRLHLAGLPEEATRRPPAVLVGQEAGEQAVAPRVHGVLVEDQPRAPVPAGHHERQRDHQAEEHSATERVGLLRAARRAPGMRVVGRTATPVVPPYWFSNSSTGGQEAAIVLDKPPRVHRTGQRVVALLPEGLQEGVPDAQLFFYLLECQPAALALHEAGYRDRSRSSPLRRVCPGLYTCDQGCQRRAALVRACALRSTAAVCGQ